MNDDERSSKHTDDDEQAAIAYLNIVEERLLEVLEDATRYEDEQGRPQFGRWAAMHALVDLAGRHMLSAIELEGEEGRRRCMQLVNQLTMLIAPTIGRTQ
jgi:hypothetical protein